VNSKASSFHRQFEALIPQGHLIFPLIFSCHLFVMCIAQVVLSVLDSSLEEDVSAILLLQFPLISPFQPSPVYLSKPPFNLHAFAPPAPYHG